MSVSNRSIALNIQILHNFYLKHFPPFFFLLQTEFALVTITRLFFCRLLNAFAEEAALEDVIYYMGEALRRGVIDLDVFLRQVRALSRKQFMLRALMQKCRQKAGLSI